LPVCASSVRALVSCDSISSMVSLTLMYPTSLSIPSLLF
jgi:hypothetical protein